MITRTTQLTVLPEAAKLFDERATVVAIEDDAGGEFISVSQCPDDGEAKIRIDPDEWPELRQAIDKMIGECR